MIKRIYKKIQSTLNKIFVNFPYMQWKISIQIYGKFPSANEKSLYVYGRFKSIEEKPYFRKNIFLIRTNFVSMNGLLIEAKNFFLSIRNQTNFVAWFKQTFFWVYLNLYLLFYLQVECRQNLIIDPRG